MGPTVIPGNGGNYRRFSRRFFHSCCGWSGCCGRFWGRHTCNPYPPRYSAALEVCGTDGVAPAEAPADEVVVEEGAFEAVKN